MLAIPFYLGVVELPFRSFILYAGVAGVAITAGTILDREGGLRSDPVTAIFAAVGLWTLLTLVLGGCSYLLALAF